MTSDAELYDPWKRMTGQPSATLDDNPFERPPRVEDLIPRHANPRDGRPKLWLPDGSKMQFYFRPSSRGKIAEDTRNLSAWTTSQTVAGYLDYGGQSEVLVLERATLGPYEQNKDGHHRMDEKAKDLNPDAARVGSAWHTITERHDLGLSVKVPPKYKAFLEEWKRLSENFELVTMPSGKPAVECFVAVDIERQKTGIFGEPLFNPDGTMQTEWHRGAGTFDRLWKYKPCPICGCSTYVVDLKTGKASSLVWSEASYAVQEGVYSEGKEYVPWPDGKGATRHEIPDLCKHRAITVSLPAGTAQGRTLWTNIAQGAAAAFDLVPRIKAHRNRKNWMVEFLPIPNLWKMVEDATTPEEIRGLWAQYQGADEWHERDNALFNMAGEKIAALTATKET